METTKMEETSRDHPIHRIPFESARQIERCYETLKARWHRLPSDLGNVIDEVCHITVDIIDRSNNWRTLMKSVFERDVLSMEEITPGKKTRLAHFLLAETYFWTAVCLIGFECGEMIGGWTKLGSVFEMMLHRLNALVLVVAVLPFFVHTWLRKSLISDDTRRVWTLVFSFAMGLLLSYGFRSPTEIRTPAMFLLPFALAWISCFNAYYLRFTSFRIITVTFAFVLPILLYCSYGWLMGRSDWRTVTWSFVMCTTAVLDLQMKLGRLSRRWASESLENWSTTVILIGMHTAWRLFALVHGIIWPSSSMS